MNLDATKQLISVYIDGWKSRDRETILSTLDPLCVLIESDGDTFRGREMIARMLNSRVVPENRIDRWDVTSFFVTDEVCFFEWVFEYTYAGEHGRFEGASIARVNKEKIVFLREYAMTGPQHDWEE